MFFEPNVVILVKEVNSYKKTRFFRAESFKFENLCYTTQNR